MTETAPAAMLTRELHYGFCKIFVSDLPAMARFYEEAFGLVSFNHSQGEMLGRPVEEINYSPQTEGGAQLSLIKWLDAPAPAPGGSVQGFASTDIQATVTRAKAAGASVPHPVRRLDDYGIHIVFLLDPEGNINEVVQIIAD